MAKQKKTTGGTATQAAPRKTPPKTNGAKTKGMVTFDQMNDTAKEYNLHQQVRKEGFEKEYKELCEKYQAGLVPYPAIERGAIIAYQEIVVK